MARGKIIIIVAPSGTGKSTLIQRVKKAFPTLSESVSFTTRPIRVGETNGVQYNFISKEEFESRIQKNDLLEWAMVHSNYYGTSKEIVEKALKRGENLLFDLDVQGCDSMKKIYKSEANVIFIEPPSIEHLEKRLRGRGTESEEVILERLNNAKLELKRKNDYDYLVVNENIDHAEQQLVQIISKLLESA